MSHTPTPWYHDFGDVEGDTSIMDNLDHEVAIMSNLPTAEANAAFIVKAVNAHDDLVAALKDALARSELRTDTKLNAETLLRKLGAL